MTEGRRPEIRIRAARRADLEPLAAALDISAHQIRQRWREKLWGLRHILVAVLDTQPVGTVSFHTLAERPDSLRLLALDVAPAFRRRGIATALVRAVEAVARRRGLAAVHLEVAIENEPALLLYRRLGYRRHGRVFVNRWWRFDAEGRHEPVEEQSVRMSKRLADMLSPTPGARPGYQGSR